MEATEEKQGKAVLIGWLSSLLTCHDGESLLKVYDSDNNGYGKHLVKPITALKRGRMAKPMHVVKGIILL